MDGKFLVGAGIVIAVAYAATVALKNGDDSEIAPMPSGPDIQAAGPEKNLTVTALVPEHESALVTEQAADAALLAHVEHKYRFLIADIDQEHVEELRRRLLARESEVSLLARARIDAQIGQLLPADSLAYYQLLKDSDLEQHRLSEYTGGISNIAPLDERQERIVLDAKLRQKQRYGTVIRDVGLDRDALSLAERNYAHQQTVQALQQYLEEFLAEVAPSLTPEQYTQLKNYETTEFARELSRLQQRINAK